MKKEIILLVLLLLVLFISCYNIDNSNKSNFKLIKNGKLLFLFENTIDDQIKYNVSNKFDIFVKEFFKQNGIFVNKKIDVKSENILIIIVEDNFHNVKYVDEATKKRINKIRKMKNGSDFSRILYDLRFKDKNTGIRGIFYPYNNIIIVNCETIKDYFFEMNLLLLIFCELNHYFIANNLRSNLEERYRKVIENYNSDNDILKITISCDEFITVFYSRYLIYQYCYYYNNNSIIKIFNMNLSFSDYIFNEFYINYAKNEIKKIKLKNIKSFLFGGISIIELIPYFYSLSFYIYQKYNGFEGIRKFINFMYEGKFNSFSDIIYYNFKLTEDKFFEEWENFTKKLFYEN